MSGGIYIQLHPLVVLNVSDHLTRARYLNQKEKQVRVIGALLGKQEGRVIEIVNTIEFSFKHVPDEEGGISINEEFAAERLEAYKKLFTDLVCIGWYSTATD
jgi:COP9 signalosome complex subunit 6